MTLKQRLLNFANEMAVKNGYIDARQVREKYKHESECNRLFNKMIKSNI